MKYSKNLYPVGIFLVGGNFCMQGLWFDLVNLYGRIFTCYSNSISNKSVTHCAIFRSLLFINRDWKDKSYLLAFSNIFLACFFSLSGTAFNAANIPMLDALATKSLPTVKYGVLSCLKIVNLVLLKISKLSSTNSLKDNWPSCFSLISNLDT